MNAPHSAFSHYAWRAGILAELDPRFPSTLYAWTDGGALELHARGDTFFGYVHCGYARLAYAAHPHPLIEGMYFEAPEHLSIAGGEGIIICRHRYRGVFTIGGPIEPTGRLRYIDGCTDSLLIGPQRRGEPCLNALYFPPGIDQTAHTHPSDRIGLIAGGRGRCVADGAGTVELVPGMIFCIHAHGRHKFATPHGEPMVVIAYHPDSDAGPTDEEHPMLTRTIVEGESARFRPDIRTGLGTAVEFEYPREWPAS